MRPSVSRIRLVKNTEIAHVYYLLACLLPEAKQTSSKVRVKAKLPRVVPQLQYTASTKKHVETVNMYVHEIPHP